ncbi:MAG: hypothetical protein MUE52_18660 [Tabrizicola sp.]|nr:hypothetical protein [Tabrizicola sp.]
MTRATALLAMLATPALAQDFSEAEKSTFLAAFAENGCAMTIAAGSRAV